MTSTYTHMHAHTNTNTLQSKLRVQIGWRGRRRRGLEATEMEEPHWSILLEIFLPLLSSQLSCSLQAIKGYLSLLLTLPPSSFSSFSSFTSSRFFCSSGSTFFELSLPATFVFHTFFRFCLSVSQYHSCLSPFLQQYTGTLPARIVRHCKQANKSSQELKKVSGQF